MTRVPWTAHVSWLLTAALLAVLVWRVPAAQRFEHWQEMSHLYFPMATLALVLTPIIITGGIDLSVASIATLSAAAVGVLWRDAHWPIGWALSAGVAVGLLAGSLNAGLVNFGVLPLVATLATRELFRGLASSLLGHRPVTEFPSELESFWRTDRLGLPLPFWILLALLIVVHVVVHHTWIGRALFAVGDNELAARFAALPVSRLKAGLYVASGVAAAFVGLTSVLEYGTAKAGADRSWELLAIACVVLGGARVTGGAGYVPGTVLGILTLTAVQASLLSAPPEWRETIVGVLLLVFAGLNEALTSGRVALRLRWFRTPR